MRFNEIFKATDLALQLQLGHVSVQRHANNRLFIYNYTPKAQYAQEWNDVTINTRGLIVNVAGEVVARPFPKFFNLEEIEHDITELPLVQEKLDGSLGIIYHDGEGYAVATRGSFTSEQAIFATKWLNSTFPDYVQPDGVTTLVEIIYPENQIVVNYGDRSELVLIAAIENDTGADVALDEIHWWEGPRVGIRESIPLDELFERYKRHDVENDEGVVCLWPAENEPSFRMKIKYPEYVRVHGIVYGFSERKIWELLAEGKNPEAMIGNVPDEFFELIKRVSWMLRSEAARITSKAHEDLVTAQNIQGNRRKVAEAVKQMQYPHLVFALLDGKNIEPMIWKMVKP